MVSVLGHDSLIFHQIFGHHTAAQYVLANSLAAIIEVTRTRTVKKLQFWPAYSVVNAVLFEF